MKLQSPNIDAIQNLATNGYVVVSGGNGTLGTSPGSYNQGMVGMSQFAPTVIPVDGDTLTIGTDVYCFTNGSPGPGQIAVAIGVDIPTTLANLLAAIIASGTANILATNNSPATYTQIQTATAPNGSLVAGVLPSLASSDAANPWITYSPGKAGGGNYSYGAIPLTTANLAAVFAISLTFAPDYCAFVVQESGGSYRYVTSTLTISGSTVVFDPTVGPDYPVAGDTLFIRAWTQ